jgi:hypothetical protein
MRDESSGKKESRVPLSSRLKPFQRLSKIVSYDLLRIGQFFDTLLFRRNLANAASEENVIRPRLPSGQSAGGTE